ncbi:MAG: YceD family protein [Bacteroidales bacterium]
MLLDLSRMRGERDLFDRTYQPNTFAPNDDYRVVEPVHLAFDVFKKKTDVRLVGDLTTVLQLECGRCVEPFTLPVNSHFDLHYLPHSENRGEGEREIEQNDLETAFYRDETLDLAELMQEQFYLVLPMKPLCRDECKGLCPHCGTNLNTGSCACKAEWVDPRLDVLRTLIDKK